MKELDVALFNAIDAKDITALRKVLAAGSDVEALNGKGYTPLHTAIVIGSASITQILLEAGADPNRGCATSHAPLVLVAKLDSPLQQWVADMQGGTAPKPAAGSMISSLLAHGADLARFGEEAASWGITNSSMEVLLALDAAGLDWDQQEQGVALPDRFFSQASPSGITTPEVVNFLLARGADPNRREHGRSLLSCFFCRGANLDLQVLDALLAAKPDIDATDALGATALMHAASREGAGRAEALACLLALGADPCLRDAQGKTAVDYAAALPSSAYLDVFRKHGITSRVMSGVALPAIAKGMTTGSYFVMFPLGAPLSLRWVGVANNSEAALDFLEQQYGFSRSPVGPFPVLQLVSVTDDTRAANPYAARFAGNAVLGNLLVLCFTAVAAKDYGDRNPAPANLRPMFAVSGVYPADALQEAQSCAEAQPGWSLVACLVTLTMLDDGYRNPLVEWKLC